jgi:secernin
MCDTLCTVGVDAGRTGWDGAVFAKNSDRPKHEPQPLRRLPPRREDRTRTTYLEVAGAPGDTIDVLGTGPAWMWGLEQGLNLAGVAIGNERVWTSTNPKGMPDALTGMDLVRLGLERGSTAAEAVEVMVALLEQHGQGGACHPNGRSPYWSSFLVADRDHAYVLETSGRAWATEEVVGSRAISNRLTIPAFDATHHFDSGGVIESLVGPRLEASQALLAEGPLEVEEAQQHLRRHVGARAGHTVCMHAEDEATTASMVAVLDGDRSRAWFLLGSPCRSVYVPLWPGRTLGEPPAWERFAALTDEDRPWVDELEDRLQAGADADDAWGPHAWRLVAARMDEMAWPPGEAR